MKKRKRRSRDEFIKDFKLKHGDKYDYSLSDTVNTTTKIKIICPIHGVFEQIPKSHLKGKGCAKCGIIKVVRSQSSNKEEFVKKSLKIYGDLYDYSLVKYKNNHTKINIICKVHGVFEQTPLGHLRGGCYKCFSPYGHNRGLDKRSFISRSAKIHDFKHNYSLVEYKNLHEKVKIICPIHGEFKQEANNHMRGKGCSKCKTSKGELRIKKFLDKNNIQYETQKKLEGCRFELPLKFDFYLPNHNTCIEYDGEQHFRPVRFGGMSQEKADEVFILTALKDQIKTNYCKAFKKILIRVSYDDINKIEEILKKEVL